MAHPTPAHAAEPSSRTDAPRKPPSSPSTVGIPGDRLALVLPTPLASQVSLIQWWPRSSQALEHSVLSLPLGSGSSPPFHEKPRQLGMLEKEGRAASGLRPLAHLPLYTVFLPGARHSRLLPQGKELPCSSPGKGPGGWGHCRKCLQSPERSQTWGVAIGSRALKEASMAGGGKG